jgi:thiamine biosynthesis protein ThiS
MKDHILHLTINGEPRQIAANTVTDLLEALGLNPQVTVVERNAIIVDRASYATTALAEGDVLELVRLVGGG